MRFWLLIGGVVLAGCASVPQKLDPDKFYKRDMVLTVNGFQGEGTLVVPRSDKYELDIRAKGKLDLFTLESCHREISREEAGEGGLFGDRKRVELNYIPSKGIETEGACPVLFGGYERVQGRHSWAVLDFESPTTNLPALVKCNGSTYNSSGVTICQSKAGLIQELDFPVEVIVNPPSGCEMNRPSDLKTYSFIMSPRTCVYAFMEKAEPHREHRLTTVGYEAILLRNN